MINIIKYFLVVALALSMITLSFFILNNKAFDGLFSKNENNITSSSTPVIEQECDENQHLEDGECVLNNITTNDITNLNTASATTSNATNTNATSTSATSSNESSLLIKKTATTTTKIVTSNNTAGAIDSTLPHIKDVTVTGGGKTMVVAIIGNNFDKKLNVVTLVTGTGIKKELTLPSYPMPNNTQSINFQITDFRTSSPGAFSFKVSVKDKESNVFRVSK